MLFLKRGGWQINDQSKAIEVMQSYLFEKIYDFVVYTTDFCVIV
jgi:hypothetical protein